MCTYRVLYSIHLGLTRKHFYFIIFSCLNVFHVKHTTTLIHARVQLVFHFLGCVLHTGTGVGSSLITRDAVVKECQQW